MKLLYIFYLLSHRGRVLPLHSGERLINGAMFFIRVGHRNLLLLIPTWDFGLVLRALSLAPFELLANASLEAITYKTFVLIALALGACRGELWALRRGQFVRPVEDWSFVLLYSDPSFIPKMARGSIPTESFYSGHSRPVFPPGTMLWSYAL